MATSKTTANAKASPEKIAQQFLSSTEDYVRSELKLVTSDYDCLHQMNNVALDKYNSMHRRLQHVNNSIRTMNESNTTKMHSTQNQLSEIEDAMSNLESTILHLDAYSRSLETQVKKYEKTLAAGRSPSST